MSMNIKDEEAHRLAKALAAATGETVTAAVKSAVREKLERLGLPPRGRASVEEILAFADKIARRVKTKPAPHGDWLYDEYGLPK
jgi:antitoxin VapB